MTLIFVAHDANRWSEYVEKIEVIEDNDIPLRYVANLCRRFQRLAQSFDLYPQFHYGLQICHKLRLFFPMRNLGLFD
jgi:energy-coupling factor transporter ATP-binding protein EcfA2